VLREKGQTKGHGNWKEGGGNSTGISKGEKGLGNASRVYGGVWGGEKKSRTEIFVT